MSRLRSSLFLLAVAVLLISTVPLFAGSEEVAPPAQTAVDSAAQATPEAADVAEIAVIPESEAPLTLAAPPIDFVLCSCKLCGAYPEQVCRISPSGYSILCSDWYRLHC